MGTTKRSASATARWLSSACWLLAVQDVAMSGGSASAGAGECIASSTDWHSFHCYAGIRSMHCRDNEERCADWAAQGECQGNPGYMHFHCRESCQTCLDGHVGVTQIAPDEETRSAVAAQLTETASYLHQLDEDDENSHLLLDCQNTEHNCTYWAVRGECQANEKYMHEHCSAACQSCH